MTARAYGDVLTLPNGGAISGVRGTRVTLSGGNLALAGQGTEVGVLEEDLLTTDTYGSVRLLCTDCPVYMVAIQAITQYADVYRAASGKVTDARFSAEDRIGIALEAASGNGSQFVVIPTGGGAPTTSAGTTTAAP